MIIKKLKPKYKNVFVAELDFMYGDADGFGELEITLNSTEDLIEFELLMRWLLKEQDSHYNRLGGDRIQREQIMKNSRFVKFFADGYTYEHYLKDKASGQDVAATYEEDVYENAGYIWPLEDDDETPATLEGYKYYQYDEYGEKYSVELEESDLYKDDYV